MPSEVCPMSKLLREVLSRKRPWALPPRMTIANGTDT